MKYVKKTAEERIQEDRQEFINRFLERVENAKGIWDKEWDVDALKPEKQNTGSVYQGKNRYKLGMEAALRNYTDNRWFTFNQIAQMPDVYLRKDSKGTRIDFWKAETREEFEKNFIKQYKKHKNETEKKENLEDVKLTAEDYKVISREIDRILKGKDKKFTFQSYIVFNGSSVEGIPEKEFKPILKDNVSKIIDNIIESSNVPINFSAQEKAMFLPSGNRIVMPLRETFKNERACLSTLLHELGHATGFDRDDLPKGNNIEEYATEELKAEFTSLFVQSDLGINLADESVLQNSAEYIAAWKHLLGDNATYLDKVLKEAQKRSQVIANTYFKYKEKLEAVTLVKQDEQNIEEEQGMNIKERFDRIEEAKKILQNEEMTPEEFENFLEKWELYDDLTLLLQANKEYLIENIGSIKINPENFLLSNKEKEFIASKGIESYQEKITPVLKMDYHTEVKNETDKAINKILENPMFDNYKKDPQSLEFLKNTLKDFAAENVKYDFSEAIRNTYENNEKFMEDARMIE